MSTTFIGEGGEWERRETILSDVKRCGLLGAEGEGEGNTQKGAGGRRGINSRFYHKWFLYAEQRRVGRGSRKEGLIVVFYLRKEKRQSNVGTVRF